MLRPQRSIRIPLRYRSSSPPRFEQNSKQPKRRRIDPKTVDRNDVDQALAVLVAAPEYSEAPPTSVSTELPHFEVNYVENRSGCSRHAGLSESGFFKLFFSDSVVEILSKETNSYAESKLQNPPLSLQKTCHWVPTTPAEIRIYLGIHLHFGLYHLAVRNDYWKLHNLGQFMGRERFKQIHRFFSLNDESTTPLSSNAPWFHRIQRVSDLFRTAC
jgi:Transposase IS4